MDKFVGKRLDGRYEIREIIGIGGMAVVYKAYDSIEDRIVAIKILKEEFASNEEFQRRFKNESKAIAVLSHPNIVKVYDVSFGDLIQYIVMECIEGITLKEYIERNGNLDWSDAINFTIQILRGLQHAHDKGIVHRDVKPQNIMVLTDKTIKVTDFGIARFARKESQTITDKAIGSVHYISPEQAKGELTDEKADIYSLGVIMYEMLTGALPFEAESAVSVAIMQLQTEPKLPTHINPLIPLGLEQITMKAMQKDTINRYKSAAEMLRDLEIFKRDPSTVFHNTYFVDNSPTKHIDNFYYDNNAPGVVTPVMNNYVPVEEEQETSKVPIVAILTGVAVTFVAAIIVLCIIFIPKLVSDTVDSFACPNFVGMKMSDLEQYKDKYNFTFVEQSGSAEGENAGKYKTGQIYMQRPEAKSQVKQGATITVFVQKQETLIEVPDVKNYTAQKAKEFLESKQFNIIEKEEYSDEVAQGLVIKTNPAAGSKKTVRSTITVYVSLGAAPEFLEVPDVVGLSLDDAKEKIERYGFTVGEVKMVDNKNKGYVVKQTPTSGGEKLNKGTAIDLNVGNGIMRFNLEVELPDDYIAQYGYISAWIDGVQVAANPTSIDGKEVTTTPVKIDFSKSNKVVFSITSNNEKVNVTIKLSQDGVSYHDYYSYYNIDATTGDYDKSDMFRYNYPMADANNAGNQDTNDSIA